MVLNDVAVDFTSSAETPGAYDTGWCIVAYANCRLQAHLVLPPLLKYESSASLSGVAVPTEYTIFIRVNDSESMHVIPDVLRRSGMVTIAAHDVPHNGVLEMRFVAASEKAPSDGESFLPPAGIEMTMSATGF
jgi:hypothetical protein